MTVLLTYDVRKTTNTIHTEVKDAMKLRGFFEYVPLSRGGKCKLPNTTLVKEGITPADAESAITDVCRQKGATLEKYIALTVSYTDGRVKSDE